MPRQYSILDKKNEPSTFHNVRIDSHGVFLDGVRVKGVLQRNIRLESVGGLADQAVLSLEIALDPMSVLEIESVGKQTGKEREENGTTDN